MRKISIAITLLWSCTTGDTSSPPQYKVTFSNTDIRRVRVNATLDLSGDTLSMSQTGISPLPDGYGTFVHDLNATDDKGNTIQLDPLGKGMWKVDAPVGTTIHLSYYVSVNHDTVPWSVSAAFARAYAVDGVLFFTGRALFIAVKGQDTSTFRIHFVLPSQWKICTTYDSTVVGLANLWDNGNLAGNIVEEEIKVDKLQVIIAGTAAMRSGVSLIRNSISKIVDSYASAMGGAPEGKLAIMGSVSDLIQGGETFGKSISLIFNQPPDMSNKDQWAELLSHEIFHLWNGQAIVPETQSQVEWFVEGFTEYFSLVTAFRTGLLTWTEFLQQIAINCDTYVKGAGHVSLVDAGIDKGLNYGLIYSGGLATAIALDVTCRRATNNKYGVSEILKEMYLKFGITHVRYSYEDIVKVSSEVSGTDLSLFFSEYVAGMHVIPLENYLRDEKGLLLSR